jgi:hypothetical protein
MTIYLLLQAQDLYSLRANEVTKIIVLLGVSPNRVKLFLKYLYS